MTLVPALDRFVTGHIAYHGGDGASIGNERFEIAARAGQRTVRAFVEMDDIGLTRDVSLALDGEGRTLDGFCRIVRHGRTESTTWFRPDGDAVEMEGWIAGIGRIAQRLETGHPVDYVGLHPVQGDALATWLRGTDAPGEYRPVRGVTNSRAPNGDEGLYAMPVSIDTVYVGREEITVTAGTFPATRYGLRWKPEWPPADIWVRESDGVFLLMRWEYIESWYELMSIEER